MNEENIFLGSQASISGFPILLVESHDVEASHSCKMEKISDEKLFYLRSRGLDRENALHMILQSYIDKTFAGLSEKDETLYLNICERMKLFQNTP